MKKKIIVLASLIALSASQIFAQAGKLDSAFSGNGKLFTDFGGNDYAFSVAIQSNGKIVAAGLTRNSIADDFALARYNLNGTLDNTFGSGGKVSTYVGVNAQGRAVAIRQNGKIVVAGFTEPKDNVHTANFAIVQYNANGTLDNTFGNGNGKVFTGFGGNDLAYAVMIQQDGKIVVAGRTYGASYYSKFALARYNTNGTLDNTFGGNGKVVTDLGTGDLDLNSIAIQADGKILVAGNANDDFALARYNQTGTLDNTFGDGNGIVETDFGNAEFGSSVALQADGKIIVGGATQNSNTDSFAIARYNSGGTLDLTFNGTGKIIASCYGTRSECSSIAIQQNGKIIAAGSAVPNDKLNFAVMRLNIDGTLDNTFSGDGKVVTSFGNNISVIHAIAIQSNGKIVAAGDEGSNFALARYIGDGTSSFTSTEINDKSDIKSVINISSVSIEQNFPNPFTQSTSIHYTLPEKFNSAQIIITDNSGKTIKQFNISNSGKGVLNIEASSLAAGVYNYSLVIDGKLIDTKKMMLIK